MTLHFAWLSVLLAPLAMHAATITLDASDEGWYDSNGSHAPGNENYIAGNDGLTGYRNYFVFNLAGFSDSILSAQLSLYNSCASCFPHVADGYASPNPVETYQVGSVSTPIAQLESTNFGGTAIFADVGMGAVYGSRTVSASDDGGQVLIALNSSAVLALNSASGLFALGGQLVGVPSVGEGRRGHFPQYERECNLRFSPGRSHY